MYLTDKVNDYRTGVSAKGAALMDCTIAEIEVGRRCGVCACRHDYHSPAAAAACVFRWYRMLDQVDTSSMPGGDAARQATQAAETERAQERVLGK